MELTRADLSAAVRELRRRVTQGAGSVPASERQRAAEGEPFEGALGAYLDRVRRAPIDVTDAEVAALRGAGHSDDALFELTVAAALGAAGERLAAGLAAIDAAYGEG